MNLHLHFHIVLPPDSYGEPFELIPSPKPPEPDWERLVSLGHGDTSQARRLARHELAGDPCLSWDQAVTRALHRWLYELAR